jgi:RNA polymerase sigma-70 factor (sigma-E family)
VSTVPDFASFYLAARPTLLRTTYAVTGDRQLAEDAVQVAFAKAYASWARVHRASDPTAYVRRIAINAAIGHHRRASFRRETPVDRLPDRTADAGPDLLERDEVWRAVRALPPRQRAVVVLRYYEDLSERQIADALGCRPGTVKSQAAAALATLRARLGELDPAEGDRA